MRIYLDSGGYKVLALLPFEEAIAMGKDRVDNLRKDDARLVAQPAQESGQGDYQLAI